MTNSKLYFSLESKNQNQLTLFVEKLLLFQVSILFGKNVRQNVRKKEVFIEHQTVHK